MSTLVIDTRDPSTTRSEVPVLVTLVDADRNEVTGYTADGTIVKQLRGHGPPAARAGETALAARRS